MAKAQEYKDYEVLLFKGTEVVYEGTNDIVPAINYICKNGSTGIVLDVVCVWQRRQEIGTWVNRLINYVDNRKDRITCKEVSLDDIKRKLETPDSAVIDKHTMRLHLQWKF